MNTLRREYLKIVGAITAAISATFGGVWYVFDDDDEDQGDGSTDAQRSSQRNDSQQQRGRETDKQQAENSSQNETDSQQAQNESQNESETSDVNETTDNESDEDKPTEEVVPDENETRPDEPTESSNPDESRERIDEDAVKIEDTALTIQNYGAAQIAGSVRNVSDQPIEIVTLEIIYFDSEGTEIGAGSDTVRHLEPGDSKSFSHNVEPDGLRGEPAKAEVIPRPFVETSDDE